MIDLNSNQGLPLRRIIFLQLIYTISHKQLLKLPIRSIVKFYMAFSLEGEVCTVQYIEFPEICHIPCKYSRRLNAFIYT